MRSLGCALAAGLALAAAALLVPVADAASAFPPEVKTYSEKEAKKFLKNLNLEWAKKTNAYYVSKWDYQTDISRKTLALELKVAYEVAKFQKQQRKEAVKYPREKFADADIKRQLSMYSKLGPPGLPDEKYVIFQNTAAELGVARRCQHIFQCEKNEGLGAEAELKQRLHCWLRFRYGKNTTDTFAKLIQLSNEAAKLDNYTDFTQYMMRNYEDLSIKTEMRKQIDVVHPFYKQMAVYCRHRLRQRYGNDAAPNGGLTPEHLVDDPICSTDPVPRKPLDFPGAMRAKDFTVRKLFGLPDEFYRSLNMTGVPDAVWDKSILEQGANKTMSCQPVAQDFMDNKDYRIRACGKVCEKTLLSASKLVTGIVFAMEMRQQPSIYRQTINDAFVDGIGGLVYLSLVSPNFLRYQGLLAGDDSVEMDVNLLYMIARNTILPAVRDYANDLWRIDVMSGHITPREYNCWWWGKKKDITGIEPPVSRSWRDFDPGYPDLLMDPTSTPFKTTFGTVLAFHMHRQLCQAAGLFDAEDPARLPLHRCNLLNQPVVSDLLKKLMQTGASKPWQAALEQTIGTSKLDASAITTYFQPLQKFLEDHNVRTGEVVEFGNPTKDCGPLRSLLESKDPAGAKAGYYACPLGEASESVDSAMEMEVKTDVRTSPAPAATAGTAAPAVTSGSASPDAPANPSAEPASAAPAADAKSTAGPAAATEQVPAA